MATIDEIMKRLKKLGLDKAQSGIDATEISDLDWATLRIAHRLRETQGDDFDSTEPGFWDRCREQARAAIDKRNEQLTENEVIH